MSETKLQDKPIVIGSPVEIEEAVNDIRVELANGLSWLSNPYFIAQRFFRRENNRQFIYPETYCKAVSDPSGKYPYHRLTPDGDYSGMCFFMVGDGTNDFSANEYNFLTYPVGIIFSVNLELIDKAKLDLGLYTQELVRDARRILTDTMIKHDFHYTIQGETRDLQRVFREFSLNDLEAYNRAPMQCFRFDLQVTVQESCIVPAPPAELTHETIEINSPTVITLSRESGGGFFDPTSVPDVLQYEFRIDSGFPTQIAGVAVTGTEVQVTIPPSGLRDTSLVEIRYISKSPNAVRRADLVEYATFDWTVVTNNLP